MGESKNNALADLFIVASILWKTFLNGLQPLYILNVVSPMQRVKVLRLDWRVGRDNIMMTW